MFREIKEKIAKETENMTYSQFKEYLNRNQMQNPKIQIPKVPLCEG